MSTRISGPPTNARFQRGIREGPTTTSSGGGDKRSETGAHGRVPADPIVIMRADDGGVELLAEDRTYTLGIEALRHLLFFGNRVRLAGGDGVAWPGADRRWICFILDGAAYVVGRYRLVAVARGSVPADWLVRLEAR